MYVYRMLVVVESEFLRRLHEYEAERGYSVVNTSPGSTDAHLTTHLSSSSSSSDVTFSSSVTSANDVIFPPRPSVDADSNTPDSEWCNPLWHVRPIVNVTMGVRRQVQGMHVHPPGFWLKIFFQRCAIAVIKINAGNAGIKSHNTEV